MEKQKIDTKIFKAYDIRGVYPEQINEEMAELVGKSVVKFLQKKQNKQKLTIVLSRDGRNSSPHLFEAVKNGILEQGVDVIDIGLCPTPMLYFAVFNYDYDGGIQITASHNPPEFNGFKIVGKNAVSVSGDSGLQEIKQYVLENGFNKTEQKGSVIKKDILLDYLKFNTRKFDLQNIKGMKVVVDSSNGASGELMRELKKMVNFEIINLFDDVDGNFPNHSPDPSKFENLELLGKAVAENQADFGICLDADGDRVFIVDEKGIPYVSSQTFCLILSDILEQGKGETFIYNVFMSKFIPELIAKSGNKAIMERVGFTFIKKKAIETNALFGGEQSGHFAHRDYKYIESPIFILLTACKVLLKQDKKMSEVLSEFQKYYGADLSINLEVADKTRALEILEQTYANKGKVSRLDGVRVEFDDWWFNARPSNTEDLLRVVIEANSKQEYEQKKKEIISLLE